MPFSKDDLAAAARLVHAHMAPTPQYRWATLSDRLGADVRVKHENHTPTGAFKVRGGVTLVDWLRRERPEVCGLVSATRGNHGQSLARAGTAAGLHVRIVVPHGNSTEKNAAMRAMGATLVENGADFDAAGAERFVTVTDDEIAEVMRMYFTDTHNVAEGAGAAPLAALVQEREAQRGKRIGVILCGGNVDTAKFAEVLRGGTPGP